MPVVVLREVLQICCMLRSVTLARGSLMYTGVNESEDSGQEFICQQRLRPVDSVQTRL